MNSNYYINYWAQLIRESEDVYAGRIDDCPVIPEGIKRNGQIDDESLEQTIVDDLTSSSMQCLKRLVANFWHYCKNEGKVEDGVKNAIFKLGLMSFIGGVKLADQMDVLGEVGIPLILPKYYNDYIKCSEEMKEAEKEEINHGSGEGVSNGIELRSFWGVGCSEDVFNSRSHLIDAYTQVVDVLTNVSKLEDDIRTYIKHNYRIYSKELRHFPDPDSDDYIIPDKVYSPVYVSLPKTMVFDVNGRGFVKKFIIRPEPHEVGMRLSDKEDRRMDSKYFRKNLHKPNLPNESEESQI